MNPITVIGKLEVRETEGVPRLHGVVIREGRAASTRSEIFAPGSVLWDDKGIGIRTEHGGDVQVRAMPERQPNGDITVTAQATPAIIAAVKSGKRAMSVEFTAMRENRTASGIREVTRAYVDGCALTNDPEYVQTSAEVRSRQRVEFDPWL